MIENPFYGVTGTDERGVRRLLIARQVGLNTCGELHDPFNPHGLRSAGTEKNASRRLSDESCARISCASRTGSYLGIDGAMDVTLEV